MRVKRKGLGGLKDITSRGHYQELSGVMKGFRENKPEKLPYREVDVKLKLKKEPLGTKCCIASTDKGNDEVGAS